MTESKAALQQALDIFRLKPRPSVQDAERVQSLILEMKNESDNAVKKNEERWQQICNMVMDQCHKQHDASLDFVASGMDIALEEQDITVQKAKLLAQDAEFPLVICDKAFTIFERICLLRRSMEEERAADAKNLRDVVLRMQDAEAKSTALDLQNTKLLEQNVDMHVEIERLKDRVKGLEFILASSSSSRHEVVVDAQELGKAVLNFISENQRKKQQKRKHST